MIPGTIKGANANFGAPKDWNEERDGPCDSLPVLVVDHVEAGTRSMSSVWLPNEAEIEALRKGHGVVVTIFGHAHPAIAIGVSAEFAI